MSDATEAPADEAEDGEETDPGSPDPARLEQLDEHIDEVRQDLEEMTEKTDEPPFIEKGSESDKVDDTIAPPG